MPEGLLYRALAPLRRVRRAVLLPLCKELLSDAIYGHRELDPLFPVAGRRLAQEGRHRFNESYSFYMEDGIALMERAWVLSKEPEIACQLGAMYERANRNADAIKVYQEAFRLFPAHPRVRYQSAIEVLRHGEFEQIAEFVKVVRRIDAKDPFCTFVDEAIGMFPGWVGQLSRAIGGQPNARQPLILSFAVWGEAYVTEFMNYACAALLAPGNIPAVSQRHSVHLALFTTPDSEPAIRAHPNYARLAAHAAVQFIHFPDRWRQHPAQMRAHYGDELGGHYALNCKFVLFSCANYSALEAARQSDGLVVPLAADNVLNEDALANLTKTMEGPCDAVVAAGFRVPVQGIKQEVDRRYRMADGTICIPSSSYAELLMRYLPENNFVDSPRFTHFPLVLCWRVGQEGFLAHANHLHPCCIRAAALKGPLRLSTDPVDGRFMSRYANDDARIQIVQDSRIVLADWGEVPLVVSPSRTGISTSEVSLWLWMYWDELRERYFRTPIRIGASTEGPQWTAASDQAQAMVSTILQETKRREAANRARKNW